MTEKETLQLRDLAEAGQVQFKERITNKEDYCCPVKKDKIIYSLQI